MPHPHAVRLALERRREAQEQPPPLGLPLPPAVKARDHPIRLHDLTDYDRLTQTGAPEHTLRPPEADPNALRTRAQTLCLYGLLAHGSEVAAAPWLPALLQWEEQERGRRRLERRLKESHIGRFKALCDFDWAWPTRCDQAAVAALMTLDFLKDASNVVLARS